MKHQELSHELARAFPPERRALGTHELEPYLRNASAFSRRLLAAVKPINQGEIELLLAVAQRFQTPLYPVSQGKNWGLGSKLPVGGDGIIVDLSLMKRIREINLEFGYATVEPGVSQADLAHELNRLHAPFYLDVTGSGADTSIVGNILDRGIAYNTLRVESLLGLEGLLADGSLIGTGFSHIEHAKTRYLYPYGVGPDATGLLLQSNFAIITAATIALIPKPEYQCSFILNISHESKLGPLVETLRQETRRGLLDCVAHIGNTRRRMTAAAPVVYDFFNRRGTPVTRQQAEQIVAKNLKGSWSAIGTLAGTKAMVKVKKKALRQSLKKFGQVIFLDRKKLDFAKRLSQILRLNDFAAFLTIAESAFGMTCGVPTNQTLKSVYWPGGENSENPKDPDTSSTGILFALPIIPMSQQGVEQVLMLTKQTTHKYGYEAAITLNLLHDKALEGVISFDFPKANPAAAHRCLDELLMTLYQSGLPPYRLDINHMQLVVDESQPYWQFLTRLKLACDPNNLIAPGRYMPPAPAKEQQSPNLEPYTKRLSS